LKLICAEVNNNWNRNYFWSTIPQLSTKHIFWRLLSF